MEILKVSAKSNPCSVAGAIAGIIREKKTAEIQAVGAASVNQTVKAIAIARGYLAPSGEEISCHPAFCTVSINGKDRTAIKFIVSAKTL